MWQAGSLSYSHTVYIYVLLESVIAGTCCHLLLGNIDTLNINPRVTIEEYTIVLSIVEIRMIEPSTHFYSAAETSLQIVMEQLLYVNWNTSVLFKCIKSHEKKIYIHPFQYFNGLI